MPIILRVQTYRSEALPQQLIKRFDQLGGAIGRAPGNDLVLEDPSKYISRVHARVEYHDARYHLVDVGSNPSLINDRPLGPGREMPLSEGDVLAIGEYQVLVNISPEAGVVQPPPLEQAPIPQYAQAVLTANSDDSLSGAKILGIGGTVGNQNFNPLDGNLFGTGELASGQNRALSQQPVAPPYRGAESDHISPELQAFQLPAITPASQVASAIPNDYDPLADAHFHVTKTAAPNRAAPESSLPVQVSPIKKIEPQPVHPQPDTAKDDHPLPKQEHATMFAPADRVVAPAQSKAKIVDQAPSGGTTIDNEIIQALLRGLGLPDLKTNRSAVELAELTGAMLREATIGTMGVLMARAMTKRESRLEMTLLAPKANNPLKFLPDADSALIQMLSNSMAGYIPPVRAFASAYDDLKAHELAILAGMRAALAGVLKRFDPEAIERRLQMPSVMANILGANRKAKMWDRLVEVYKDITNEADDDFQRLFGEKFAAAYEEQIQRLRDSRK